MNRRFLLLFLLFAPHIISAQLTTVHSFINETGALHNNGLITDGSFLYGTRYDGGEDGKGYIFKTNFDGSNFVVLLSFGSNALGANPVGQLVLSGTTLYGITSTGAGKNAGMIYRVEIDGSGAQGLGEFYAPATSLIVSGTTIYGSSTFGGYGSGNIFKMNTDGSNYQDLHIFDGMDVTWPIGDLAFDGSVLYGGSITGGVNGWGGIFKIGIDGSGYQKLYDFDIASRPDFYGGLVHSGGVLYGTHSGDGTNYGGTIFSINTDGSSFQILHNFGSEGKTPKGVPRILGSKILGMTSEGGNGYGLIYQIDLTGANYQVLHSFTATEGKEPWSPLLIMGSTYYGQLNGGDHGYGTLFSINSDGSSFMKIKDFESTNSGYEPMGSLTFFKGVAYGITKKGGDFNLGVVYKMTESGSDYQVLYSFDGTSGAYPTSTLTLSGSSLFGVTSGGGANSQGTLFRLDTTTLIYEHLIDFNKDINGGNPTGALTDTGGDLLYGMTGSGIGTGGGTIFAFSKTTANLSTIYQFGGAFSGSARYPKGSVVFANSRLYGICSAGVFNEGIALFSVKLDGTSFTKFFENNALNGGRIPSSIISAGKKIYGITEQGGSVDWGVLFSIDTAGTNFKKLIDFSGNRIEPTGNLVEKNGFLFGMTISGSPGHIDRTFQVNSESPGIEKLLFEIEGNITSPGSLTLQNDFLYGTLGLGSIVKYKVTFPVVTEILSNEPESVVIYPNPTNHLLFIDTKSEKIENAQVMNAFGKIVCPVNGNQIDVSQLPAGLYYLLFESKAIKFIKQ